MNLKNLSGVPNLQAGERIYFDSHRNKLLSEYITKDIVFKVGLLFDLCICVLICNFYKS